MKNPSSDNNWIAVGVIARAHGLRGSIVVKSYTRTTEEFVEAPMERVFVKKKDEEPVPHKITYRAIHKGVPMINLEGVSDRTAVEKLIGAELLIPASEKWELEEGEYYVDDLAGMELVEETTERAFGKVLRVVDGPAHDFLVFTHPDDSKREVLLPFVPEFTPEVNFDANRIVVKLPDGLLEL